MYKLFNHPRDNIIVSVFRTDPNDQVWSIPFVSDNTDYIKFKADILSDKAELQDADGNLMTSEEAKQFIATLP